MQVCSSIPLELLPAAISTKTAIDDRCKVGFAFAAPAVREMAECGIGTGRAETYGGKPTMAVERRRRRRSCCTQWARLEGGRRPYQFRSLPGFSPSPLPPPALFPLCDAVECRVTSHSPRYCSQFVSRAKMGMA